VHASVQHLGFLEVVRQSANPQINKDDEIEQEQVKKSKSKPENQNPKSQSSSDPRRMSSEGPSD
jgi:hypothetical protein